LYRVSFQQSNAADPRFFYGIVSYGLAIIALTLVVRFALYPLSAGSIRNMSHASYSTVDAKAGQRNSRAQQRQPCQAAGRNELFTKNLAIRWLCFPVLVQMPVLLPCLPPCGSPFSDVNYTVNLQIFPLHKLNKFNRKECHFSPKIYISDGVHVPHRHCSRRQPLNGGRKKKSNFKP